MKKIFITAFTVILLSGAFAQDLRFSGNIETMWGVHTPGTEKAGELSVGKTDFTPTLEIYKGNATVFAEASFGYDAVIKEFTFNLSEAYFDYSSSNWGTRIGAQKIVWGKADEIDITNSVFPSDSTSLFIDDDSLAVYAARVSFSGASFTIDGYWIPFARGNRLPLDKNNPMRKAIIPDEIKIPVSNTELVIPVYAEDIGNPEIKISNGEYGIKASAYLPVCDVSIYGFYGFDKTPIMNYEIKTDYNPMLDKFIPSEMIVTGEHKRISMIGFDAAFPIGATVLRIEQAFFPSRCFQSSAQSILSGNGTFAKGNQITGLAGIDWMPSEWTITAQYYYDAIPNKPKDIERKNTFTHGMTLSISRILLQETLELSLSGIIGFNDFDSAINFSSEYSITDQLKISAGTYFFIPGFQNDGTYGRFKNMSSAFIKCRYTF